MSPEEIRVLRGSMSRAAFARQVSVTALSVYRWELPDGNKESRRPRGEILDRLHRLAGTAAADGDRAPPPRDVDVLDPAFDKDEAVVLPILERLYTAEWPRGEDALLGLLDQHVLTSPPGRALASLGLSQVQLVMRADVSGARKLWAPVAEDVESGSYPASVAARAYVIGALIFSARDDRSFDPARTASYIARAEALLADRDDDQRVMLLRARVAAARFGDPRAGLEIYRAHAAVVDRASSPIAQFTAVELRGFAAHAAGDDEAAARYSITTRSMALHLGLAPLYAVMLTDRAHRMMRGAVQPESILEVCREVRELVATHRLPTTEALLVLAGIEIEALCRAGRFEDARTRGREALDTAVAAGLGSYVFSARIVRPYFFKAPAANLSALVDELDKEAARRPSDGVNVHILHVRALLYAIAGDYERAVELGETICSSSPGTVGLAYVVHDAYVDLVTSRLMLKDVEGAVATLQRLEALLRERPSVWHSAMAMRGQAAVLTRQGRLSEARQKLEATAATFGVVGDVGQVWYCRRLLALVARAGSTTAADPTEEPSAGIMPFGTLAPELFARARELWTPLASAPLLEQSLTERLVVAIERLSVCGLPPALIPRELGSILGAVFPGRQVILEGERAAAGDETVELGVGGQIGIRGALDAEQHAALRLLAMVIPMAMNSGARVTEEDVAVDAVLPGFVAATPATRRLKAEVAQLSRSSATILIDGESGSGKEVVARAVHELSTRSERPYVIFNCASIPRELFESQLFGHRRGSFTGATHDNLGVIRAADGGTLFLDEIGELPLEMQPKLLRFLENGEVLPIGEQKARQVDVRVIAATHRDLVALVREGKFREDLFYRLNVVPLRVPPLRDRQEDVFALARLFISRMVPEGTEPPQLAVDALSALKAHRWPGNVRELRNMIERAMAYTPIPRILHANDLRIATVSA
jgi:hypothetical protein